MNPLDDVLGPSLRGKAVPLLKSRKRWEQEFNKILNEEIADVDDEGQVDEALVWGKYVPNSLHVAPLFSENDFIHSKAEPKSSVRICKDEGQQTVDEPLETRDVPNQYGEGEEQQMETEEYEEVESGADDLGRGQALQVSEAPIASFSKVEGQKALQNVAASRIIALIDCYVIFAACSTLMIVASEVQKSIPAEQVEKLGSSLTQGLTLVVSYGAVPFLVIMLFRINNYFSERMYYKYLQRGHVLDFPLADYTVFHKKGETIVFLLYFVLYVVFSLIVFVMVGASLGHFFMFVNYLFVGVLLSWYKNQTIELTTISLVRYIESFKDADGNYDNIDVVSLTAAATMLQHIKLVEAPNPSYTATMRSAFFDLKNVSRNGKWFANGVIYSALLAVAVATVVYVLFASRLATSELWQTIISPCVLSCVTAPFNQKLISDPARCQLCLCQCLANLGHSSRVEECKSQLDVSVCSNSLTCLESCSALTLFQ